jgi:16S rRNA G966 N2-methylase RsmD
MRPAVAALRGSASRLLERALGVETRGLVWQKEVGYAYGLYRPTSWVVLRELFRRLEVGPDDVFLDVGSGMGRVVLMAARRPFKRVIGVEQNGEMTAVARRNVEAARGRLACRDVELVTADVLDWEVPDDVTVVYLYCPFPEQVLERFMERLLTSIDRCPRTVRLIYNFSTTGNRETIRRTGRAQPVELRVPRYVRAAFREIWMVHLGSRARLLQ